MPLLGTWRVGRHGSAGWVALGVHGVGWGGGTGQFRGVEWGGGEHARAAYARAPARQRSIAAVLAALSCRVGREQSNRRSNNTGVWLWLSVAARRVELSVAPRSVCAVRACVQRRVHALAQRVASSCVYRRD